MRKKTTYLPCHFEWPRGTYEHLAQPLKKESTYIRVTAAKLLAQQIVSSRYGVDITCQVQVELGNKVDKMLLGSVVTYMHLVHRNDLTITTTSGATLDAKSGTLTGLPDTCKSRTSKLRPQSLS